MSFIIPSRNELPQLLFTIQGVMREMMDSGIDYEIVVVLNKCSDYDHDELAKYRRMRLSGRLRVIRFDEAASCWLARQAGMEAARGEYLFFLDSHVLPWPGSYVGAFEYAQTFTGALHLGVARFLSAPWHVCYQYRWMPEKFWGAWSRERPEPPDYHILSSGFAATLYHRDVWIGMGGLNPHFQTYGGAELYLDLKTWMFGYEVRCHPSFIIDHLAIKRGWRYTNYEIWYNSMLAAYVTAGERALTIVFEREIELCNDVEEYIQNVSKLRDQAREDGEEERLAIEQNAAFTADEILSRPFVQKTE